MTTVPSTILTKPTTSAFLLTILFTKSNTQGPTVSGGGGSKLVFDPDDRSQWARLNADGSLDTDNDCAASGITFTELEISQTDAVLFVVKDGSNELELVGFEAHSATVRSYPLILNT